MLVALAGCSLKFDTGAFRTPPPVQPSLQLLQEAPTTLDDLIVSATSVDPLGESVDFVYEWWRTAPNQPEEKQADLVTNTVTWRRTKRDEVWRVRVTPVTAVTQRRGEPVESTITILNTPPIVQSIGFSTYQPHENESVEAFAVVEDPDLNAISLEYQWLRNGVEIEGKKAARLKLSTIDSLEPGDTIQVRVQPSDPQLGLEHTSTPVTVVSDVARWRAVLPDRDARFWWTFWDPLHQRVLILSQEERGGSQALWEFAVDSGTGKGRYVPLPEPDFFPEAELLATSPMIFDADEARGIAMLYSELPGSAEVWALDLSDRSRPVWEQLAVEGDGPSARIAHGFVQDEETRNLWIFGGATPFLEGLSEVWRLELTADGARWHSTEIEMPRPNLGGTLVSIPGERRSFLFGGAEIFGSFESLEDITIQNRVWEIQFDDGQIAFTEWPPLPESLIGAFGTFVPSKTDASEDRIYNGAGSRTFASQDLVEKIWSYDPRAQSSPVELPTLEAYPPFSESPFRVAPFDQATGRILVQSAGSQHERGFWSLRTDTDPPSWEPLSRYGIDDPPGLAYAQVISGTIWGGVPGQAEPPSVGGWKWDALDGRLLFVEPEPGDPSARAAAGISADLLPAATFGGLEGWPRLGIPLASADLWEFYPRWTPLVVDDESPPLTQRFGHVLVGCAGGNHYYFGGRRGITSPPLGDTGHLDCEAGSCLHTEDVATPGPPARAFGGVGRGPNGSPILFGGDPWDEAVWSFNCSTRQWQQAVTTGEIPGERYGHGMTYLFTTGTLVITGGHFSDDATDAWVLKPNGGGTYLWEEIAVEGPAPPARRHHAALFLESADRLAVYGGAGATLPLRARSDLWTLRLPDGSID